MRVAAQAQALPAIPAGSLRITPEMVHAAALCGLGELVLTGCTTSADHHYLFPRGAGRNMLDEEIRAACELGIRFHPTRGSMSRGTSEGGLPPDDLCQKDRDIIKDCVRVDGTPAQTEYFVEKRFLRQSAKFTLPS